MPYAKKGSTKIDIFNKLYDDLMNHPQVNPKQLAIGTGVLTDYPTFASIPVDLYHQLAEHYIYQFCYLNLNQPVNQDLRKVKFDYEFGELEENDDELDIHEKFPDGTEMLWMWSACDCESCVSWILYLDPQNTIRAYIPVNGNCYCTNCNSAWGACNCGANEPVDFDVDFSKMYDEVINQIQTI